MLQRCAWIKDDFIARLVHAERAIRFKEIAVSFKTQVKSPCFKEDFAAKGHVSAWSSLNFASAIKIEMAGHFS